MPPIAYDERQIAAWLSRDAVSRARGYGKAVSELHWSDGGLQGKVQGTQRRPYDVYVRFRKVGKVLRAEGECTCPVGFNCKHVAAVLIAGLEHPPQAHPAARDEIVRWIEGFKAHTAAAQADGKTSKSPYAIAYVITLSGRRHEVQMFKARRNRDGTIRDLYESWSNVEGALIKPPLFVTGEDLVILRALWLGLKQAGYTAGYALQGINGAGVLPQIIATGRAFVQSSAPLLSRVALPVALAAGDVRSAKIEWQVQTDKRLRPALVVDPPATMTLLIDPPWYIDAHAGQAGPLNVSWSASQLDEFLAMPPIEPGEAALVGSVLREVAPQLPPLPCAMPHPPA